MRIGFFVPDPIEGSGGHKTILRHAERLLGDGHEVVLYLDVGADHLDLAIERALSLVNLPDVEFSAGFPLEAALDVGIATAWFTVVPVLECAGIRRRMYFVQDYEGMFSAVGYEYNAARQGYALPLDKVSIGNWLRHRIHTEFGGAVASTPFGAELDVYGPLPTEAPSARHSVCAIFQPDKARRAVSLLLQALEHLAEDRPGIDIYLYGSRRPPTTRFPHHFLGLLSDRELAQLYRRCGVGISLSTTNPSRIPFEMAASGLPVVEIFNQSTLFDFPDDGVTLAYPSPRSLADAVGLLLDSAARRQLQRESFGAAVERSPVAAETKRFAELVESPREYAAAVALPLPRPERVPIVVSQSDLAHGASAFVEAEFRAAGVSPAVADEMLEAGRTVGSGAGSCRAGVSTESHVGGAS